MHAPALWGEGQVSPAVRPAALDQQPTPGRPSHATAHLALPVARQAQDDLAVGGEAVVGHFYDGGEDFLVGGEFAGAIDWGHKEIMGSDADRHRGGKGHEIATIGVYGFDLPGFLA